MTNNVRCQHCTLPCFVLILNFFQVAYTPEVGGDYFISVQVNGIDIQGSPFTVSSDPMPRESYLDMYRSMEPDFSRRLQADMLGTLDQSLAKKQVASPDQLSD
jgi:hypothetical protein